MNSIRKFWTEKSDDRDMKYVCGSHAIDMRTKQWKTFSIYFIVSIELPVKWDGERIGRRKKKERMGRIGRGNRGKKMKQGLWFPLIFSFLSSSPALFLFFDYSSHRPEPLWRGELKPIVQYHVRYTQLHFAALFPFTAPRLDTNIF